jgi:hypothetical protein
LGVVVKVQGKGPTERFTKHATLDHTKRVDFDVKCSSRLLHYLRAG